MFTSAFDIKGHAYFFLAHSQLSKFDLLIFLGFDFEPAAALHLQAFLRHFICLSF